MAEQTFLNESGIKVTNSRFIVPGETYAMSGITSVKTMKRTPSRKGPIALVALGLIFLYFRIQNVGFLLLIAGVLWWFLNKPKYAVLLHSASGEAEAFSSKDGPQVTRIIDALNNAIVARG